MAGTLTRRTFLSASIISIAGRGIAAPQSYDLVAARSRIDFIFVTGGTRQTGTVPVETARIVVDPSSLAESHAEVTADIRKVTSGVVFVTQAIKSAGLLDAETHPIVRFVSTGVRLGARGRISDGAEITGSLTLRGVTRPITLRAQLSRPAGTAPDDLSVLTIRLAGALNRQDYGASGYAGLADDRVELDIRAEIRAR